MDVLREIIHEPQVETMAKGSQSISNRFAINILFQHLDKYTFNGNDVDIFLFPDT